MEGLVEFARWDECRGEALLGRVGDDGGSVENFDNWGVAADVRCPGACSALACTLGRWKVSRHRV